MAKQSIERSFLKKPKIKRKGIHAKSNTARTKTSKNYKKPRNRGGN